MVFAILMITRFSLAAVIAGDTMNFQTLQTATDCAGLVCLLCVLMVIGFGDAILHLACECPRDLNPWEVLCSLIGV